jgi:hypothetical protein
MDQEKIDAIKLVQEDSTKLEFLSDEMKDDKDVVFAAVNTNCYAAFYASPNLWGDKEFVLYVLDRFVSDGGYPPSNILPMVSKELLNDKDIIIAATERLYCKPLRYASESLRDGKEIVIIAVNYNGCSLKYASKSIRDDKEIVLAAVQKSGWAIKYASEPLRDNKDMNIAAVQSDGMTLEILSKKMRSDEEIIMAAIFQNPMAIIHVSKKLRDDEYFLHRVDKIKKLNYSLYMLSFLSERIKEEIKKDICYLDRFEVVYVKPAVYK